MQVTNKIYSYESKRTHVLTDFDVSSIITYLHRFYEQLRCIVFNSIIFLFCMFVLFEHRESRKPQKFTQKLN